MAVRTMVHIDEDKCDGCGLCVPDCAEGALQIIDGKAKLVSDIYCDGLGACLGSCPRNAITMVRRDADGYDEGAVADHLRTLGREPLPHDHDDAPGSEKAGKVGMDLACGCPGTLSQSFKGPRTQPAPSREGGGCPGSQSHSFDRPGTSTTSDHEGLIASRLGNWPVQISLVPPKAPYLESADILIAADCAPFAYGDFHRRFMEGKVLLVGCPKLDDVQAHIEKLSVIFKENHIRSIGVVFMEVPCCSGLVQMVREALRLSDVHIPTTLYRVGIKGDFVEEKALDQSAA